MPRASPGASGGDEAWQAARGLPVLRCGRRESSGESPPAKEGATLLEGSVGPAAGRGEERPTSSPQRPHCG